MPTETFKSQTQAQAYVKSLIKRGCDPGDIMTQTLPGTKPTYVVTYNM